MWTLTGGDHGEAAILDLGKLHASAAGTLAEAEGIEHEVAGGAARAVHGLEEGGEGDELEETDPEEHLVEGAVGASGSEFCHRRGWEQGVSCVPASVSLACSALSRSVEHPESSTKATSDTRLHTIPSLSFVVCLNHRHLRLAAKLAWRGAVCQGILQGLLVAALGSSNDGIVGAGHLGTAGEGLSALEGVDVLEDGASGGEHRNAACLGRMTRISVYQLQGPRFHQAHQGLEVDSPRS